MTTEKRIKKTSSCHIVPPGSSFTDETQQATATKKANEIICLMLNIMSSQDLVAYFSTSSNWRHSSSSLLQRRQVLDQVDEVIGGECFVQVVRHDALFHPLQFVQIFTRDRALDAFRILEDHFFFGLTHH